MSQNRCAHFLRAVETGLVMTHDQPRTRPSRIVRLNKSKCLSEISHVMPRTENAGGGGVKRGFFGVDDFSINRIWPHLTLFKVSFAFFGFVAATWLIYRRQAKE